jgi:hypothetical protein
MCWFSAASARLGNVAGKAGAVLFVVVVVRIGPTLQSRNHGGVRNETKRLMNA